MTSLADGNSSVKPFIITTSARTLFDLEDDHRIYEEQGLEAYTQYQRANLNTPLEPGPAFALVKKLLDINKQLPPGAQPFEVVLLSRNSTDTGMRVMNAMEEMGLGVVRAIFTGGAPSTTYIDALGAQLFLSSNPEQVREAISRGVAAATIMPSKSKNLTTSAPSQLRIAFDGDSVIFSDEAERAHHAGGLEAFHEHEVSKADTPLPSGPFRRFLEALHNIQKAFPQNTGPIRTALVTARSMPAHARAIKTLQSWGIEMNEALFLGGRDKAPFLKAFGADLFFDDSDQNIRSAMDVVASGHVLYGLRNEQDADESRFTGGARPATETANVVESEPARRGPGPKR